MTLRQIKSDTRGYIFDIQGLSVHDGPGCRTLIFLNGCTLNCNWCSNPEGISRKPSLLYYAAKCISCGNCIQLCPNKAIRFDDHQKLEIDRAPCSSCEDLRCTTECYTDALKFSGYEITVSRLFDIVRRDRQYWGSQGGVTLTGGEPLLQIEFVKEFLSLCYESYIHTAIETCGNVPWENFQQVLPSLDWIFFDLKHLDSQEHKKATTAGNALILENAQKLSSLFKGKLVFRLPLIPHFNDGEENIQRVIAFIQATGRNEINLLPLHHLGREKYNLLGKEYAGSSYPLPTQTQMRKIREAFTASGILCNIGSETPY